MTPACLLDAVQAAAVARSHRMALLWTGIVSLGLYPVAGQVAIASTAIRNSL